MMRILFFHTLAPLSYEPAECVKSHRERERPITESSFCVGTRDMGPKVLTYTPFPPKKNWFGTGAGSKLVRSWFNSRTRSEPICFSTD